MAEFVNSPKSESMGSAGSAMSLLPPLSVEEVEELTDAFNSFDLDKDGRITKRELSAVLRQLGMRPSDEDLNVMMSESDVDGDGCIDLDEFLQINAAAQSLNDVDDGALLREVFEVFDKDKDGVIRAEELLEVLSFLCPDGQCVTLQECSQMIKGVDANGDGVVDFLEFQQMMQRADLVPDSR